LKERTTPTDDGLVKRFLFIFLAALVVSAAPAGARPLETALVAGDSFYGSEADLSFAHARSAGTTRIRLELSWREIAPSGATKPAGFDAANPFDAHYRWGGFDQLVQRAVANGLEPFIGISDAPGWAERGTGGRAGTNQPDAVELGLFAEAAARRFSGGFTGLPRVRVWEVWNEPNASFFLFPQRTNGQPVSPGLYRRMVNEFAAGVKRVSATNLVIAGGLFPFVIDRSTAHAIGPLPFMRSFLCLSKRLRPERGCSERARFDIWSHHPYTSGGPTHRASNPDNVSIRELPLMRKVLRAGVRSKHIIHSAPVRFWVTEFSWDTNPPDPKGVPVELHARWVSEALYRMWRAGVSLVTWFQLRDSAAQGRPHSDVFESGLYYLCDGGVGCDQPKISFEAFRFPLVAFRSGRYASVWGRTPGGRPGSVIVDQQRGRRWRAVGAFRAGVDGIFEGRVRRRGGGPLRARLYRENEYSIPFSLVRPADLPVNPFG
jgi:hypothetical protein